MSVRIGYVGVHLPTYYAVEQDQFGRAARGLDALGADLGFDVVVYPEGVVTGDDAAAARQFFHAQPVDLLLVQGAACCMIEPLLELAEAAERIAFWATPEPELRGPMQLNSFVTMSMYTSAMHRFLGQGARPYKWFYGHVEEEAFRSRIAVTVRALRAIAALRSGRIGRVGALPPGFDNLRYDARRLRHSLGVRTFPHELREITAAAAAFPSAEVAPVAQEMRAAASEITVDPVFIERNARVYLALRQLVARHGYTALAVQDWPELQDLSEVSPLLALAWLGEADGLPAAGETDVQGAASMMLLGALDGGTPTLVDMALPHPDGAAVLLWHLGSSPHGYANADGVRYTPHTTLGRKQGRGPWGVAVDMVFAPGPVTLCYLGRDGTALLILAAELVERDTPGLDGDRAWATDLRLNGEPIEVWDLLNTILVTGQEHHYAVVRGDWSSELAEVAAWLGLETVSKVPLRPELQRARPRPGW